jgi:UDP-N-acetylmuramoyl-tripeptide--D-alanyl-D-alanine ligase
MDSQSVSVCGSGEEAVPLLTGLVKPGDVILVKGSRGMRLEKIIEALTRPSGEG